MFKTIVLATDLSPAWNEIIACAGEFQALGCAKVVLTHVISVKFMVGMEGKLKDEARPVLEAQKAKLEAQGQSKAVASEDIGACRCAWGGVHGECHEPEF